MKKRRIILLLFLAILLGFCAWAYFGGHLFGSKDSLLEKGTQLLEEEKYDEAIETFEKALSKDEDAGDAYLAIGLAYYQQGEYGKALDALKQAVKTDDGKVVEAYRLMGNCSMEQGDYQGALNSFNLGVLMAEDSADCEAIEQEMRRNEIVCYEKLEDWESASQKAEEYLTSYADDEEVQKEAQFLRTR